MNEQDFLRYSRQLLLAECGVEQQQKLAQAKVLIIGLGGLGCPVAHYLAGAGVGKLLLADHDCVDISNLHRQTLYSRANLYQVKTQAAKQRLTAINPNITITEIPQKLTACSLLPWVKQADLVLDCCDNFTTRQAINQICVTQQKPLISAAAIGFQGQLVGFFPPYITGCYQCLYPNPQQTHLTCQTAGVLGATVGIIGALQALEAMKFLLGLPVSCSGRLQLFDGKTLTWQQFELNSDPNCPICSQGMKNENLS